MLCCKVNRSYENSIGISWNNEFETEQMHAFHSMPMRHDAIEYLITGNRRNDCFS